MIVDLINLMKIYPLQYFHDSIIQIIQLSKLKQNNSIMEDIFVFYFYWYEENCNIIRCIKLHELRNQSNIITSNIIKLPTIILLYTLLILHITDYIIILFVSIKKNMIYFCKLLK